jgi:hypothetical protein
MMGVNPSEDGNGNSESTKAEPDHALHAASGTRFSLAKPIPPSGWKIERESAWHRAAAWLYALGASQQQVCKAVGKSPQSVCNLVRQPFFQEKVCAILAELAKRDIIALFKAEALSCLATLIEIRDNREASVHARIECARDILDRALGKAVQRVETAGVVTSEDPVAEVARRESEVKRLREEGDSL